MSSETDDASIPSNRCHCSQAVDLKNKINFHLPFEDIDAGHATNEIEKLGQKNISWQWWTWSGSISPHATICWTIFHLLLLTPLLKYISCLNPLKQTNMSYHRAIFEATKSPSTIATDRDVMNNMWNKWDMQMEQFQRRGTWTILLALKYQEQCQTIHINALNRTESKSGRYEIFTAGQSIPAWKN